VTLRAVLFDVDFTLCRPGPSCPQSVTRASPGGTGSRWTPGATTKRAKRRSEPQAPSRAAARRDDLAPLHRGDLHRHGRPESLAASVRPRSKKAGESRRTSSSTRTCCPCSTSLRAASLRIAVVSNGIRDLTEFVAHHARRGCDRRLALARASEAPPDDLPGRTRRARGRAGRRGHGRRLARGGHRGSQSTRHARDPGRPRRTSPGDRRTADRLYGLPAALGLARPG
jgi:hypothetical protein